MDLELTVHHRKHRGYGIRGHWMMPVLRADHLAHQDGPPNNHNRHLRQSINPPTLSRGVHLNLHRMYKNVHLLLSQDRRSIRSLAQPKLHPNLLQPALLLLTPRIVKPLLRLLVAALPLFPHLSPPHLLPLPLRHHVPSKQLSLHGSYELPTTIAVVKQTM